MTRSPPIVRPLEPPADGPLHRDQRRAGEPGLGRSVEHRGGRDRRQRGRESNGLEPGPGDEEVDRVAVAGRGVGIEDRLAERAGAAVRRRRDQEEAVFEKDLGSERGGAGRLGDEAEGGVAVEPGGGVKLKPSSAAFNAERVPR